MNSSDDAMEAELRALGESLRAAAPESPESTVRAVRARLEADALGRFGFHAGPERRARLTPRRLVAGAVVVLAVVLGVTPQGRAAVASVLRFAGIEIATTDQPRPLPSGVPSPLPGERRVTLREARRTVRFPIAVPAALGDPADVRVADGGRVVSLLWPGIRLDEFDGTLSVVFRKELGPPWPQEAPPVHGWWIEQPHAVSYIPAPGRGSATELGVAGPTLIWQRGPVGLRLECSGYDLAVRIATSVR